MTRPTGIFSRPSTTTRALVELLPDCEPATLLIDTYFDRVHWFTLVFFQKDFRRRFAELYSGQTRPSSNATHAFIALVSTIVAIGSQYIGTSRRRLLDGYGVDPDLLRRNIFAVLKSEMLDIVSSGSLEAAQACILMGSFYLYQGHPGLAWPIFGCALRVAQALNLHRERVDSSNNAEANEARKRCWWAIYEVETFCCMLYGYPSSISDEDCDITRLDPYYRAGQDTPQPSRTDTGSTDATLLSYKYFMSELSTIIQSTLRELYSLRSKSQGDRIPRAGGLQRQIQTVAEMDARLLQWQSRLPSRLRMEHQTTPAYATAEDLDRHIKAAGPQFEDHIYQLQALALKLAYENARILVHRPLLLYRMVSPRTNPIPLDGSGPLPPRRDPFQFSLETCREAALETSKTGDLPVFPQASSTYAVCFVSMHLFTAGVTLSIMASLDPLSTHSYHAKAGLRKLMNMQRSLKAASSVAAQGLELLERLTRLLMEKELRFMLDTTPRQESLGQHDQASEGDYLTRPHATESQTAQPPVDPNESMQNQLANGQSLAVAADPSSTGPSADIELEFRQDPVMTEAFLDFESSRSTISSIISPATSNG